MNAALHQIAETQTDIVARQNGYPDPAYNPSTVPLFILSMNISRTFNLLSQMIADYLIVILGLCQPLLGGRYPLYYVSSN